MFQRLTISDVSIGKFYQLPKILFVSKKYKHLSSNAKVVYAVLKDRMDLSVKNGFVNEQGEVYFHFDEQKLSELTGIASRTLLTIRKDLSECGLLDVERTGRANRYYLTYPIGDINDLEKIDEASEIEDVATESARDFDGTFKKETEGSQTLSNKQSDRNRKNCVSDTQKLPAIYTNFIYTDDDDNINKSLESNSEPAINRHEQKLIVLKSYLKAQKVPELAIIKITQYLELEPSLLVAEAVKDQLDYMRQRVKAMPIYDFSKFFINGLEKLVASQNLQYDAFSERSFMRTLGIKTEEEALPVVCMDDWLNG